MALSDSVLSGLIKTNLLAGASGAVDNAALTALCDAIAAAVVTHITTAAVIPAGIPVATTGTAAAQSGATTAPGIIT